MNKLYKIKDALEALAVKDVETIKEIQTRRLTKEKAAMDAMVGRKFDKIDTDKKIIGRRLAAKSYVRDSVRACDRKSILSWKEHQKHVVERRESKVKKERLTSAKNYRQNNGLDADDITNFHNYQ